MRFWSRSTSTTIRGLLLTVLLIGCAADRAEDEHKAALRGEEEGLTRAGQAARLDRSIELAPGRARYWELRALYRIDMRDFVLAKADLDASVQLAVRPYLRFLRGLVLCQSG